MSQNLLNNRNYTIILAREIYPSALKLPNIGKQWKVAEKSLLKIAQQCEEFAPNQLTIYLASEPLKKYNQVNTTQLNKIIENGYQVEKINIYQALKEALNEHFIRKDQGEMKENGEIILVILDSEPQQRSALIKLLIETTKKINSPHEIGIKFAQVGDNLMARGFLQALDDDLHRAGAKEDIIDTQILAEMTPEQTMEFLLNAVLD